MPDQANDGPIWIPAFYSTLEVCYEAMLKIALGFTRGDLADAEVLVDKAIDATLRRCEAGTAHVGKNFCAFLQRAVVYEGLNYLRGQHGVRVDPPVDENSPDAKNLQTTEGDPEAIIILRTCVEALPKRARCVVVLNTNGYTHQEIADNCDGVNSASHSATILKRALRVLRECMEKE